MMFSVIICGYEFSCWYLKRTLRKMWIRSWGFASRLHPSGCYWPLGHLWTKIFWAFNSRVFHNHINVGAKGLHLSWKIYASIKSYHILFSLSGWCSQVSFYRIESVSEKKKDNQPTLRDNNLLQKSCSTITCYWWHKECFPLKDIYWKLVVLLTKGK